MPIPTLTAADGHEALRIIQQHAGRRIARALLDVVLSKMNGPEVRARLLALDPEIRFLFTSGYTALAIQANFLPTEGLALIQKPYHPDELLRRVREVLDAGPA